MEQNNQSMMIESANPSMLWANIASYLGNLSKSMNKTYAQRIRKGGEITWAEIDEVNKNLMDFFRLHLGNSGSNPI